MSTFHEMHKVVPEGECGAAKVEHFTVTEEASRFTALRGALDYVPPGRYARLLVGGHTVMSDTDLEHRTNFEVVRKAQGDVLIAGLGLGMILWPIVAKPEVRSVLVVELRPEVIALVGPHLPRKKLRMVVEGDIYTWRPPKGTKYDTIYFDIWSDLCTDNLDEMTKLHRAFCRHKAPDGWMGSWGQEVLRYRRRQEQREERTYRMISRAR